MRSAAPWRWLPVAAALFVTGSFAIPGTSAAPQLIAPTGPGDAAPVPIAPGVYKSHAHRPCAGCGRLMSIRRIEATKTTPAYFEFTVRLRDGSLHTSTAAEVGRWRPGDRIVVLGGAAR